jgi:hypothetical protein
VSNWVDPLGGEDEPPQDRFRVLHAVMPWWRPVFLDEPEYQRERQEADREWEREQADDEGFYYEPKEPTDG